MSHKGQKRMITECIKSINRLSDKEANTHVCCSQQQITKNMST